MQVVTFIPGSRIAGSDTDLVYSETASRHRSIHLLLQDLSGTTTPRTRFLLIAYREIISRYMTFGRIEHPLPLLRGLMGYFDGLAKRVDTRVDDFDGLGLHVLVRDGNTFYLLTGRANEVWLRRGDAFVALRSPDAGIVNELPVDTAAAQKELFSRSMRDFLGLYRIDGGPGDGAVLEVVMGGNRAESEEVRSQLGGRPLGEITELDTISHKVLRVRFEKAEPLREAALPPGPRGTVTRRRFAAAAAAVAVVAASVFGVSLVQRARDGGGQPSTAEMTQPVENEDGTLEVSAAQESPPRHRAGADEAPVQRDGPEPGAPDGEAVALAPSVTEVWRFTCPEPITSTPALDGKVVYFGARDEKVYALDATTGEQKWVFRAADGVGASPVIVGNALIAADYKGNVYSIDRGTGAQNWKSSLPAKIVATPRVAGGEVMVGCFDGGMYVLSLETGRQLWKHDTGGRIWASAASSREQFYVPSYDGRLYALAQGSGALRWRADVGARVRSTPDANETRVVVGTATGVRSFDTRNGSQQWHARTRAAVNSFVLLSGDLVFAGDAQGRMHCLEAGTGESRWRFSTGDQIFSKAAVRDNWVFVTSYDRNLYVIDVDSGEEVARFEAGGALFSSPVVSDGLVYFGSNHGVFYCVDYSGESSSASL